MNKFEIKNLINCSTPIIFEIGCADGGDTQDFVNTFTGTDFKMYCFEPEPTNIEIFKSRNFNDNVKLFEGAVGDYSGYIEFNRSRSSGDYNALRYSGSINKPKEHLNEWPFIVFDEKTTVPITTLDNFCNSNKISHIDFIWADVQGAEDKLIKGGVEILKNTRYLYTEYSNKEYYIGQMGLTNLLDVIGNDWEILKDFGTDVLLKNKTI
jgi:FkbM family methyltransferase